MSRPLPRFFFKDHIEHGTEKDQPHAEIQPEHQHHYCGQTSINAYRFRTKLQINRKSIGEKRPAQRRRRRSRKLAAEFPPPVRQEGIHRSHKKTQGNDRTGCTDADQHIGKLLEYGQSFDQDIMHSVSKDKEHQGQYETEATALSEITVVDFT